MSLAWRRTFYIISLTLKPTNLGLTQLILMVFKTEATHRQYRSHPSPETHALFISARNHTKCIQLAKNSFINRKCQNLSRSNFPRGFWHLAKNISHNCASSSFPPMLHSGSTTAVSSTISKAKLFTQTFAHNSTLNDAGLFPPHLHPLTILCLLSRFFVMTFSLPSLALILGRTTVLMESLLSFSETVLQCLHSALSNFSVSVYPHPPFLFARSLLTFNLFLRRVTARILQTTDHSFDILSF